MKLNKNKGFTLLELLVVIVLIGLMASIVMVALSSARNKGKDSSIKGTMTSLRPQAQLYNTINNNFGATTTTCTTGGIFQTAKSSQGLKEAVTEIEIQNGSYSMTCAANPTAWAVSTRLNDGTFWCVDYTGRALPGTANISVGATFGTCI